MHLREALLTAGLIFLTVTAVETACGRAGTQKSRPSQNQGSPPTPIPSGEHERVTSGWQRYDLDGDGDRISVLLPSKPEDFGVADVRRPSGEPLKSRVHMLSADAKVYFALFVDLPRPAAEMSRNERSDIFHGCWMGVAARTRQVLEEKFGAPFPVTDSAERVGEVPGGERHMQDFKIGTENGRAQIVFLGQRAYMVVAVWNNKPGSEEDALRFLNSFQVHRERR